MLQIPRRPTGGFDKGSATTERRSAGKVRFAFSWIGSLLTLSRVAVLAAVFQAGWYFGGTNSGAIFVSAVLALVAVSTGTLALLSGWRPGRPSALAWLPGSVLAAYVAFQCLAMPTAIPDVCAPKLSAVQQAYGSEPAEQLMTTGNLLRPGTVQAASQPGLSLIRYETERSLVTLFIALAIMITSSFIFSSHSSRTWVMRAVLANATALSVWGIVQRARGTTDLLPGIANTAATIPFASFIYKNSAAAAIIPGVAAAMSLFYLCRQNSKHSGRQDFSINRYYRNEQKMLSTRELGILFLGCVVAAGVIASLSRGGWIACGLAVAVGLFLLRKEWMHSRGFVALMALLVVCIGITGRVASQVERRLDLVTIERLSDNERIEHWKLGWKTAKQYQPLGSGLGTYGYATLIEQTEPTRVWFADAHNQYLEVFTELGAIGFGIILGGIVWCVIRCWKLLDLNRSSETRSFGLFALFVVMAAAIQSIGDFVMKLPPNLFQLSLIVGLLGAAGAKPTASRLTKSAASTPHAVHLLGKMRWAAVCVVLIAISAWALNKASIARTNDRVLQQANLNSLEDGYDDAHVQNHIEHLTQAIATQPNRASLYRHRGMFYLAQYRQQLIKAAAAENETVQWANTRTEWLHLFLNSLSGTARTVTVQRMTSGDAMCGPLALAIGDFAQALLHNPTYAQVQATVLGLAPLLQLDPVPWSDRFESLSYSDPEKMYLSGFYAFYRGDRERAKTDWRNSLKASLAFANPICLIGLTKFSAIELAVEVIPPNRPDVLINLVQTILSPSYVTPHASLADSKKIAIRIAESVLSDTVRYGDRSFVASASIFALAGDNDRAADAWLQAIEQSPRDPQIRYNAADTLRACGRWNEALKNATLGASLSKDRTRFEQLIRRIQQQIEVSKPKAQQAIEKGG